MRHRNIDFMTDNRYWALDGSSGGLAALSTPNQVSEYNRYCFNNSVLVLSPKSKKFGAYWHITDFVKRRQVPIVYLESKQPIM